MICVLETAASYGPKSGSEAVRGWVKKFARVNIIAATFDDCRDICIEGESGILTVCPRVSARALSPRVTY